MTDIFLQLLPFFALLGCGYIAVWTGLLSDSAIASLTRFVFYFALSAMLFNFASDLPISYIFDRQLVLAYSSASLALYFIMTLIGRLRGCNIEESAIEAQCGVIGNTGFLGLPVLVLMFGDRAAAPIMLTLSVDLVLFGSLVVAIISANRDGRLSPVVFVTISKGLLKNPMILAMVFGLLWSLLGLPKPGPLANFLDLLGAAATPCALFAIGGSLVAKTAERVSVAGWISFAKLVLHPIFVVIATLWIFEVDPFLAAIVIASSSMPVAGNIYILAEHYQVAPHRVSSSILFSTIFSIVTLTLVIGLVSGMT
ncbi:MAG: AEC family transporter [Gammaproteobacteria bacterium]|nr:AEC family transporter [Gammaproteobacteria bacterium]MCY4228462.1 AEC family transporter [Gammaproteobacteria bacterium]MCY4312549.1 AEC family transporter [Gammaproteobacteria bacterium]